jgi:hypothetical protein
VVALYGRGGGQGYLLSLLKSIAGSEVKINMASSMQHQLKLCLRTAFSTDPLG